MAMGADVERTYDLSDEATANVGVDDDFTSVQWFESLRRLEEAIAKLEAFEPNVTEEYAGVWAIRRKFTRVMAYDLPPYAPDAYEDAIDEESNSLDSMDPERVATAEEIARSIASDSGSVIESTGAKLTALTVKVAASRPVQMRINRTTSYTRRPISRYPST